MSKSNPPNILFFSKKCKTCNLFINMCQQNKILKYFQLIDVDDKIKELSEKGLKVVPTIIVSGLTKPIEGKNVFNWLETILSMNANKKIDVSTEQYLPEVNINQNSGAGSTNPNNNIVKRNIATAPPIISLNKDKKEEVLKQPETKIVNGVEVKTNGPSVKSQPFGFLQDEMTGFSDTFAYLMTDNPLPKSFLPCDKDLEIYTAPEGDKLDKKQQDLLMRNIEMIRDNDKNLFIKNMETEHQKILIDQTKKR